jgi:hypothetical protein
MRVKKAWKDSACLACCTTALVLAVSATSALSAGAGTAERGGAGIGGAGRVGAMREMNASGGLFRAGFTPRVVVFHGGFTPHMTPPATAVREPATATQAP